MILGLDEFNAEVKKFSEDLLPKEQAKFFRLLVLTALRRVVMRTPVDTGRARGGWQVSANRPSGSQKFSSDPISEGAAVVSSLTGFENTYLSNNVDYILYLENGHSRQAPTGMVAVTFEEMKQMFR